MPGGEVTERLVVVSPHRDDAVLACGEHLAANPGAIVITGLARRPPSTTPFFLGGEEELLAPRRGRRREAALQMLEAGYAVRRRAKRRLVPGCTGGSCEEAPGSSNRLAR